MSERPVEAFNAPFGYTEKQIKRGIKNLQADLQTFRAELEGRDEEPMKDFAIRVIPRLEKTLEYVNERTPAQMIGELREIYSLIATLESSGATREQIGDALLDRYCGQILVYQPIFNQGWIETALQAIAAAATRRHM